MQQQKPSECKEGIQLAEALINLLEVIEEHKDHIIG